MFAMNQVKVEALLDLFTSDKDIVLIAHTKGGREVKLALRAYADYLNRVQSRL